MRQPYAIAPKREETALGGANLGGANLAAYVCPAFFAVAFLRLWNGLRGLDVGVITRGGWSQL